MDIILLKSPRYTFLWSYPSRRLRDVEDFWHGRRSDAVTLECEPERALFQMAIYGSLFQPTLEANLNHREGLDLDSRLDFIKYCIPDWCCRSYRGFEVKSTGPYMDGRVVYPRMDQYSIRHILKSSKWTAAWEEVRKVCGADFEDVRRQRTWVSAVQTQGLEGFEMLRQGGAENWRDRLMQLREKIEQVDPARMQSVQHLHGELVWLEAPMLEDEIYCCVRARWPVRSHLKSSCVSY